MRVHTTARVMNACGVSACGRFIVDSHRVKKDFYSVVNC